MRGDERAAGEIGFHDDCAEAHAGDDAITDGKALLVGGAIEGKLSDHSAIGGDPLEEFGIFRRKDNIDAGAKHGDGAAFGHQGSLMGGGIDATSPATDHSHVDIAELITQLAGDLQAVMGGLA